MLSVAKHLLDYGRDPHRTSKRASGRCGVRRKCRAKNAPQDDMVMNKF